MPISSQTPMTSSPRSRRPRQPRDRVFDRDAVAPLLPLALRCFAMAQALEHFAGDWNRTGTTVRTPAEARLTRRESSTPPPVPTIFTFTKFSEGFHFLDDHGSPAAYREATTYRISFVNDGTRPVRVLDLGYEIFERVNRDGRGHNVARGTMNLPSTPARTVWF